MISTVTSDRSCLGFLPDQTSGSGRRGFRARRVDPSGPEWRNPRLRVSCYQAAGANASRTARPCPTRRNTFHGPRFVRRSPIRGSRMAELGRRGSEYPALRPLRRLPRGAPMGRLGLNRALDCAMSYANGDLSSASRDSTTRHAGTLIQITRGEKSLRSYPKLGKAPTAGPSSRPGIHVITATALGAGGPNHFLPGARPDVIALVNGFGLSASARPLGAVSGPIHADPATGDAATSLSGGSSTQTVRGLQRRSPAVVPGSDPGCNSRL